MTDFADLERRLEAAGAREQVELDKFGPESSGDLTLYVQLRDQRLQAERALSLARGEETAMLLEWPVPWDGGAPLPHLLANGHATMLLYYALDIEPGWDGTTVQVTDPSSPAVRRLALAQFEWCHAITFGGPNDEVFGGHRLVGHGFGGGYDAFEVRNSRWVEEAIAVNSVHHRFDPDNWKDLRHFFLAFHDETVEVLARGYRVEELTVPFKEALELAKERLEGVWEE